MEQSHSNIDVILPCYNPGPEWIEIIAENLGKLRDSYPGRRLHLIVSNDGSERNVTPETVERLLSTISDSEFIDYPVNCGKGATLRRAVRQSSAPLILYTDIDFPYETLCTRKIIEKLDEGFDVVMAIRNSSYRDELSPVRHFLSCSSRQLNRRILGMKYSDAQGGLKGFNRRGREIFLSTRIERFLFDTEFIRNASRDKTIKIAQTEANLRAGIHMPPMGLKTMRREFTNFLRLLFQR